MNFDPSRRKMLRDLSRGAAAVLAFSPLAFSHGVYAQAQRPGRPGPVPRPIQPLPVQPLPQIPGGANVGWRQWVQQLMVALKQHYQTVDMQVQFHGNQEICEIYFTAGGIQFICYVRGRQYQIVRAPFPRRPSEVKPGPGVLPR